MLKGSGTNPAPVFNSIRTSSTTKTANYAATVNDGTIRCNAAAGMITISLPAAASVTGLGLCIKKIDGSANVVTIDPAGTELIDGVATMLVETQWQAICIQSNGTGWDVLAVN